MISIIIPVFNEQDNVGKLIRFLKQNSDGQSIEIIVSDGGSSDDTMSVAIDAGALVLNSTIKGRAAQMNYAAASAKGDILYFVHADTLPPVTYVNDICQAISNGYSIGRYRTKFDSSKWLLHVNAFFTRFDFFICYGGDQTLFITRKLFQSIGGFDAQMQIMEEYDLVKRAREKGLYRIIPKNALVSARKYDTNSWLTVQLANKKIIDMYKQGASQNDLKTTYRQLLKYK